MTAKSVFKLLSDEGFVFGLSLFWGGVIFGVFCIILHSWGEAYLPGIVGTALIATVGIVIGMGLVFHAIMNWAFWHFTNGRG